ncbi:hypothetical protein HYDPIDRAFT_164720 [Hydnomerulius pinastri MD-312]|nr:hypothetical protein HYDPIDRAFT_164720 [Hydnomerulius pinastri MD-312]
MSNTLGWSSLTILATGLLVVGPGRVVAQSSTAVCLSSFNWMDNSKGQNPCLVAAYLQGACNDGQFTVDPLPVSTHYVGPDADEQNGCQCSSVTYSAISACGLCQNRTIIGWSSWDLNCTTVYPSAFPYDIPSGTAVPEWAYQDVTTSDMFNVTLAQAVGDTPESTATHVQSTGSIIPSTTGSVPASLTNTPAPTQTQSGGSGSGKSSNTGAIAGGVVGGIVGLAAIVGVIVYFVMKKKRSQIPPSAQFNDSARAAGYTNSMYTSNTNPFTPPAQMTQQRLYDPSDPSTFPTSPPSPTIFTSPSNNYQNPSVNYSAQSGRPGGYSGAPEV